MTTDITDLFSHSYEENFAVTHTIGGVHLNHVSVEGVRTRLTLPMDILSGLTTEFLRAGMELDDVEEPASNSVPSPWDHPDLDDWRYEVSNGDTMRSFAEWLEAKAEEAAWDLELDTAAEGV